MGLDGDIYKTRDAVKMINQAIYELSKLRNAIEYGTLSCSKKQTRIEDISISRRLRGGLDEPCGLYNLNVDIDYTELPSVDSGDETIGTDE